LQEIVLDALGGFDFRGNKLNISTAEIAWKIPEKLLSRLPL
jgi:hypothetical protein